MYKKILLALLLFVFLSACNTLKYVPEGESLLTDVDIRGDKHIPEDIRMIIPNYVRQKPNVSHFELLKYSLSGRDTTKWINRVLRRDGEAPVIYDEAKTEKSRYAIERYLYSAGYFNARVSPEVIKKKRKVRVKYHIKPGKPYKIRNYSFSPIADSISNKVVSYAKSSSLSEGALLNSEDLDRERTRIVKMLKQDGYYDINRNYFYFDVDTAVGNNSADVFLRMYPFAPDTSSTLIDENVVKYAHPRYKIGKVTFLLDLPEPVFIGNTLNPRSAEILAKNKCENSGDYYLYYEDRPVIKKSVLLRNCLISPGEYYNEKLIQKTYTRFTNLQILKYVNIRFVKNYNYKNPVLDCYIIVSKNKKYSFSTEIEGTNTAGDLGVAGNISVVNKNFLHAAEQLKVTMRGAYEALSSNFTHDYTEVGGEISLSLPDFRMPFINENFKRKIDAGTEFRNSYLVMSRPEFRRTIFSTGVRYNINNNSKFRQVFDIYELSYVYMSRVDSSFKSEYLSEGSYLKYAYEDHFILRTSYSFTYSSQPLAASKRTNYVWRGSVETAGNLLYALYSMSGKKKDEGAYKVGNVNFAQYIKGEAEYSRNITLGSDKNRFAFRIGGGIAYPYGNSKVLPFEKRFFSGGANSVRGWTVRSLGPGKYKNKNGGSDYMNQSGDVKVDFGCELRNYLFWKFESALFFDAGNIWTLRKYENQPGGQFTSDFYRQIASSVGLGLRMDFDFFLIRLDVGFKVFDPAEVGDERYRLKYFGNSGDYAVHFAIGYPF